MREHAVIVVGSGPTGMMLGAELKLGGVDVAIVEKRATQDLASSRSRGLHSRTIEVFDQRGIADRFLSQGYTAQVAAFSGVTLDLSDFPTRHSYGLALGQHHVERILADWVRELSVPIYRQREVSTFTQDDTGVDIALSNGESLRAEYLVGCDGGRSSIRKAAGIEFPGWDPTTSWLIAEVETAEEPKWGFHQDASGAQHAIGKADNGRSAAVVLMEKDVRLDEAPTLRDVREALMGAYGTDFGIHSPTWISRFTDMSRQAARYRHDRVLLAGDAAHVHPPIGGQGLNIGVQDAVNLGWKLAQVVKGISPETLLDTYQKERHPVAARVLRNTMAQVALRRTDERSKALGEYVSEMLRMDEPRKRLAAEMSGLGVHYDLGAGHPLLGRRMPDLDVITTNGPLRIFTLLHAARPVLLKLGNLGAPNSGASADRVQLVDAAYEGTWELPALGKVPAPTAVLIRPDGYVAWVGERTYEGLTDALTRWFGAAAS